MATSANSSRSSSDSDFSESSGDDTYNVVSLEQQEIQPYMYESLVPPNAPVTPRLPRIRPEHRVELLTTYYVFVYIGKSVT